MKSKPAPRKANLNDAVFAYTSVCCSAPAQKPPCVVEKGQIVGAYLGAKPTGETTLGHFRCSNCRKACKVTRSANKSTVRCTNHTGDPRDCNIVVDAPLAVSVA